MQELQRDIDTQSKTSILQFLQFFCNGQSTLNPGSFYPLFSMFAIKSIKEKFSGHYCPISSSRGTFSRHCGVSFLLIWNFSLELLEIVHKLDFVILHFERLDRFRKCAFNAQWLNVTIELNMLQQCPHFSRLPFT